MTDREIPAKAAGRARNSRDTAFTSFITFKEVPLQVHGHYYKYEPATDSEPASGGYVELDDAYHMGSPITKLIAEEDWLTLENRVYTDIVRKAAR